VNTNGRTNADVVRPYLNGLDVVRRPQSMWIVDFGVDMSLSEAAQYEKPFEYVRRVIYPIRVGHREAIQVSRWWLHARPAPDMRKAIEPLNRFIMTSLVAKHRLFAWGYHPSLPDHALAVFAREDDYFFGVLHSRAHEVWSLRMGTSLEDRPRYTPSTCFETFPFPWPARQGAGRRFPRAGHRRRRQGAGPETPRLARPARHQRIRTQKAHPHQPLQPASHLAATSPRYPRPRGVGCVWLARGRGASRGG